MGLDTQTKRKYALHIRAHWNSSRITVLDGKTVRLKAARRKRNPGGGRPRFIPIRP